MILERSYLDMHGTTARNLRTNDLGKVILGCTWYTMRESLSNKIFGLPSVHFTYVKEIKPGLPFFLFNYSDRQIHGIYEAASNGEMNINPYGLSEDGSHMYPSPKVNDLLMQKTFLLVKKGC
ncbi:hypothetical protein MKW98_005834 [Papaver atlanticum]|uniref:DCD domain-containing protein n=1 Tax=Papaver atlanticum TaxID=357466 RepID=A0AAD4XV29_9MAGN|nr:hypothetical protein MKW98_005834 [Papaver atlanticum]